MCSVSRALYLAAIPKLYETVNIQVRDRECLEEGLIIAPLLQTLSKSKGYFQYVKNIHVGAPIPRALEYYCYHCTVDDNDEDESNDENYENDIDEDDNDVEDEDEDLATQDPIVNLGSSLLLLLQQLKGNSLKSFQ